MNIMNMQKSVGSYGLGKQNPFSFSVFFF